MIKTFNWLVLGNKCEIYLLTKEMKKKKKGNDREREIIIENVYQIEKKGNYHRMFSNRKKKGKWQGKGNYHRMFSNRKKKGNDREREIIIECFQIEKKKGKWQGKRNNHRMFSNR